MNWRDLLDIPDAINWYFGGQLKESWLEDLPERLYLDHRLGRISGHPTLYAWRADLIDLIALPVGGLAAFAKEIGISVALSVLINQTIRTVTRLSRKDDEVPNTDTHNPLWWLSWAKCQEAGYIYLYEDTDGSRFLSRRQLA